MAGFLDDYTTTLFRMPRIGPVFIGALLQQRGYNVRIFSEPVKHLNNEHLQYIVSSDVDDRVELGSLAEDAGEQVVCIERYQRLLN